jgi:hypothetical protein
MIPNLGKRTQFLCWTNHARSRVALLDDGTTLLHPSLLPLRHTSKRARATHEFVMFINIFENHGAWHSKYFS